MAAEDSELKESTVQSTFTQLTDFLTLIFWCFCYTENDLDFQTHRIVLKCGNSFDT